jgi:hypothetical protein
MRNLIFVEIITGKICHDVPNWNITRRTSAVIRKIRKRNSCTKTDGASSDRVILSCNFAKICSKKLRVNNCWDVWRQWVGGVVFGCDVTSHPGAAFITPVKRPHCKNNFCRASVRFEQTALQFIRCIEHKVWFDEMKVFRIRMNLHPNRSFIIWKTGRMLQITARLLHFMFFSVHYPLIDASVYIYIYFPPPMVLRPNAGHGLLTLEVYRPHTTTHHSR